MGFSSTAIQLPYYFKGKIMLGTITRMPFCFWIALSLFTLSGHAFAIGQTTRVSVGNGGVQPNNDSSLGYNNRGISANGRFVVFQSAADNLVVGDTNKDSDIFVHDLLTHKIDRVNVASNGEQTPINNSTICANCSVFSLSADGRYIAFASVADNLVVGDTNSASDIFVHDRQTKQTTRVNVSSNGIQAVGGSYSPSISADGRYVAFESIANNLIIGDTNSSTDVFVHDRLSKKTTRISINSNGSQAIDSSFYPDISADGRYVSFESYANNLVAGDTNFGADVFVCDRQTKQITRVNVNSNGEQAVDPGIFPVRSNKISADGRYVVFHSFAENLVSDDTNGLVDVFVRDLKLKQTSRVSVGSNNTQGNAFSLNPDISANGRFVVFTSYSSLALNDTNNSIDVYLHDRSTHQASVISVDLNGSQASGFGSESGASISADGRYVAFEGWALPLIGGANFGYDVFVRDRNLFTVNPTDLQITTTTKPASLAVNGLGNYTYTISNKGLYAAYANITHLVSNGSVASFTLSPNQGKCNSFATVSLCQLGLVQPGGSVTLALSVKALRGPLTQQLTLFSGGRDDPSKINNYVNLGTPVTP